MYNLSVILEDLQPVKNSMFLFRFLGLTPPHVAQLYKVYQAVDDNDFLIFQDKLSISLKDPIKDIVRSSSYSSVNDISFRVEVSPSNHSISCIAR